MDTKRKSIVSTEMKKMTLQLKLWNEWWNWNLM